MLPGRCTPFSSNYFTGFLKEFYNDLVVNLITAFGLLIFNMGLAFLGRIYVNRTNRFDAPLKVAILVGLPALFGLWLALSIAGSCLVGVGYGFFTPWISSFEAFRLEDESMKFYHCLVVSHNLISLS